MFSSIVSGKDGVQTASEPADASLLYHCLSGVSWCFLVKPAPALALQSLTRLPIELASGVPRHFLA